MRIAICDDNMEHANVMEDHIYQFRKTFVECDVYRNGEEFISAFCDRGEQYDVIFLDMEMEQLNGIETANYIREVDEHVIIVFVTSHTEYMRESFKCAPFRFLVKPVNCKEFEAVFYDISKKLSKQRKVFAFADNKAKIRLYCDDIIYCESQDHWIWIYTKEKRYRLCKPLTELYSQLDKEMFCRVHKSFIINFLYIKSIKDNSIELYHCKNPVTISRSYRKTVLEEYTNFLERDFRV